MIKKLEQILFEWQTEQITDGEALDAFLPLIKDLFPSLHDEIMKRSGEELSDAEAIELIEETYNNNNTK